MNKLILSTIASSMLGSMLYAGGDISPVELEVKVAAPTNTLADAFKNGKVSGQIRTGYINFDPKLSGETTTFSIAIGGQLKYETAAYYGFSLGAAFYTSHAILGLSGERSEGKYNDELSGDTHYDTLAESYINYHYEKFNIRIGRQLIDTPYADSDDIRMTPNTFEGVVASYGIGSVTLLGAYLTKWQGPDAESYDFVDLLGPDADGIAVAAVTYADDMFEGGIWYYGADETADVFYGDVIATYTVSDGVEIKGGLQYASQNEKNNSGIDGRLFGAMAELGFSGMTLGIAYDTLDVDDGKEYFGGFGGGVGFVNMDEMTAGTFTLSQGIDAWKFTFSYDFSEVGMEGLNFEYDYGNFKGDKLHEATEQNIILSYAHGEEWNIEAVYSMIKDENMDFGEDGNGNPADGGFNRLLVRANYNF